MPQKGKGFSQVRVGVELWTPVGTPLLITSQTCQNKAQVARAVLWSRQVSVTAVELAIVGMLTRPFLYLYKYLLLFCTLF